MTRLFAPLPAGPFGVVLADPPWRFETRTAAGQGKSPERHYRTAPAADLARLPVARIAARDCALFLWCTWPTIFQAERLIEAWGFTYSGLAWEWIKWNPRTDKLAFNGGYGTRKNVEPCLLGRRGHPRRLHADVPDTLFAPQREHSRKPDEQYARIERLYRGPSIELFARHPSRYLTPPDVTVPADGRRGWAAWGNEALPAQAGQRLGTAA